MFCRTPTLAIIDRIKDGQLTDNDGRAEKIWPSYNKALPYY